MPQFNLPHLWPSDFQMEQFSQRHCSFWSSNAQLKSLGAQGNPAAVSAPLKNSKPKRWPSHESPKTAAMGLLGQQEQLQQIFGKTTEIELYIIKYVYIYVFQFPTTRCSFDFQSPSQLFVLTEECHQEHAGKLKSERSPIPSFHVRMVICSLSAQKACP